MESNSVRWLGVQWASSLHSCCLYTGLLVLNSSLHVSEDISKSFWTGRLDRELQMIQLSATRCNCVAILWVSLMGFAAISLCVASQRAVPNISVYFIIGKFWIHPRIGRGFSRPHRTFCANSCHSTTRCHNLEDHDLNLHRRENLKISQHMITLFRFCRHLYYNKIPVVTSGASVNTDLDWLSTWISVRIQLRAPIYVPNVALLWLALRLSGYHVWGRQTLPTFPLFSEDLNPNSGIYVFLILITTYPVHISLWSHHS